jgi:hypothetical protein
MLSAAKLHTAGRQDGRRTEEIDKEEVVKGKKVKLSL